MARDLANHVSRQLSKLVGLQTKRIALAVSGGVDSMALGWLVAKWGRERNLRIDAFVIDHGLRADSRQEQAQVCKNLKILGINPHKISIDLSGAASRVEEMARERRLEALKAACASRRISTILFGHHLDDQYESFVIRKSQGSSWFGLAGMRQQNWLPGSTSIKAIRPLLDVRKRDLVDLCVENKVPWFEDYTNTDPSLTLRNAVRKLHCEYEDLLPWFLKPKYVWGLQQQYSQRRDKSEAEAAAVVRFDATLDEQTGTASIPMSALRKLSKDTLESTILQLVTFVAPVPDNKVTFRRSSVVAFVANFEKKSVADCSLEVKRGVLHVQRARLRTVARARTLKDVPSTNIYEATGEWSRWHLVDHRFWFRWRLPGGKEESKRLAIFIINNPQRREAAKRFKEAGIKLHKDWQLQPFFAFLEGDELKVVGFPTLGAYSGLEAEYRYKASRLPSAQGGPRPR